MSETKRATLYRMVMPEHVCPYGLKSKWLLESHGYAVDDHWLRTRAETDAFKIDGIELSDGRWFTRDEVKAVLAGKGDGSFWVPPPYAIAGQLVKAFAEEKV